MGSNKSKEKPVVQGEISLETDNYSYRPGDIVKGNVFIHMLESFSTDKLVLRLKVEEYTYFNNLANRISHFKNAETSLVYFRHSLIAPGKYQYPFFFALPKNLPGSFEYYDRDHKAYVTYILEAELPASNPKNSIKNSSLLIVNQPLETLGIRVKKESHEKLYTYCCIPHGSSTLKASLPHENFYANDTIKILCELDNRDSGLNAKDIKAKLIQNILLKDKTGRCKLIQRTISKVHFKYFYPKREVSRFSLEIPMSDADNPTRVFLEKCDHIKLLKDKRLVSNLQASIKSELINCTYILELQVFYNGIFKKSAGPKVKVAIAVYIPDVRAKLVNKIQFQGKSSILPEKSLNFCNYPSPEQIGISENLVTIQGKN
jgi:hypothetical protein